jgi:hypothetical protein
MAGIAGGESISSALDRLVGLVPQDLIDAARRGAIEDGRITLDQSIGEAIRRGWVNVDPPYENSSAQNLIDHALLDGYDDKSNAASNGQSTGDYNVTLSTGEERSRVEMP